ncbi:beta-alanyl-bioamine nonribosomal peptide synthetase ebony [Toxorhynchites rutilus septentrionalis]|uniref:beta-alanyl-bioamine nonribosomal peptide synthetase ebony n=1 Tax=Toxorhynchites rutilus septentrionalis TaxID=329112 RepID=UPI00247A4635|nr:beta-alanyl-bioamine nonribosomal peptide synthetase ebony [Toxorhynchites rutilus septentrionalis]XP_055633086.1 beta-alanyl-bioamine nonribosomal peptide synthetase ebony [Toxorhynchites rutilus septentrionalis]
MGTLPQLAIIKGQQRALTPALLHRTIETNVDKQCGLKTALIYNDEKLGQLKTNYHVLNSTANRLAAAAIDEISNHHKSQPNRDGDYIIAVCMHPSDRLVTMLLSIWKAGAAYLPLDPTFPPNRIEHILGEARPLLVVYEDYENVAVFGETPAISYADLREKASGLSNANILPEQMLGAGNNELALVLYTSGSTGVPKGVRLNHATIMNRLQWQWNRFPYSETEKVGIFKTALTFVDSVTEIWGPLMNGMAVVVVPKKITNNPEKLVELLEEYRIERLVLVPTLLRSLLLYLPMQKKKLLYNLRIWVCSGEPLQLSLAKEFFDYFEEGVHELCNFYGSTEVMGDVTYFVCESKKQLSNYEKVPIGYPLDNTVIYILDPELHPVKSGDIGELFVAGLNVAQGYVNGRDPQRFIENPMAVDPVYTRLYRTGDFASVSKGCVYYEGRTDSQIKIRGHRVDLSEVEKNLLSLPGVDKGIVLCYHGGEIDQALLAFITVEENSPFQTGVQVEGALERRLAHYMIPQVIMLDTIPLLVNGKMDRQSLLKMYENTNNNDDATIEIEYDYSGVPEHKLDMAKDLFTTVGEVIGRSTRAKISLQSNFYELGGNSLNSIVTVTQLCQKGHAISITSFIGADNLGEILDKMYNNQRHIDEQEQRVENEFEFEYKMQLTAHPLADEHKEDAINILTYSFYEKADLERWIKPLIKQSDYRHILEEIWDVLIEKQLSFVIKNAEGQSVGVSLNFDAYDEPEPELHDNNLVIIFEFLEHVENPIREQKLPKGKNEILHSFMMGTCSDLNAQENIEAMHFMENEVLKIATRRKFTGILTTNTSPLTQQLGSDVYKYENMLDYQINRWVCSDGTRPFGKAPDDQRVIVHWKNIRKQH